MPLLLPTPEQMVGFHLLTLVLQANELFADVMCVAFSPVHSSARVWVPRAPFFILHRNQPSLRWLLPCCLGSPSDYVQPWWTNRMREKTTCSFNPLILRFFLFNNFHDQECLDKCMLCYRRYRKHMYITEFNIHHNPLQYALLSPFYINIKHVIQNSSYLLLYNK